LLTRQFRSADNKFGLRYFGYQRLQKIQARQAADVEITKDHLAASPWPCADLLYDSLRFEVKTQALRWRRSPRVTRRDLQPQAPCLVCLPPLHSRASPCVN